MKIKFLLFYILIFVSSFQLDAQINDLTRGNRTNRSNNENSMFGNEGDTTKNEEPDIRKIVRGETDSLVTNLHSWTFSEFFDQIHAEVDTTIAQTQIFDPLQRDFRTVSTLGNIGSAYHNLNFFTAYRTQIQSPFIFAIPYDRYLINNQRLIYFNTNKPFSLLQHSTGTKQREENTLQIIHAQNINKYSGFGVHYHHIGSTGEYPNQKLKDASLAAYVYHKKSKYELYLNFISNKFQTVESGGVLAGGIDPTDYTLANLSSAGSVFKMHDYNLIQKLNFHTRETKNDTVLDNRVIKSQITHHAEFSDFSRVYSDLDPNSGFYDDINIDSTETRDSSYYRNLKNSVDWQFNNFLLENMNMNIQWSSEFEKIYYFKHYILLNDEFYQKHSTAFSVNYSKQNVKIFTNARYYLLGYSAGDLRADFKYQKTFGKTDSTNVLSFKYQFDLATPSPFFQHYYSNHVDWQNDFGKITAQHLQIAWESEYKPFSAKMHLGVLRDYIFYNTHGKPEQISQTVSVAALELNYDFNLGQWHWYNSINAQYATDSKLNLPLASLYSTIYFSSKLFEAGVPTMIGIEAYYNTPFYRENYNPATAIFYSDNSVLTGNYPFANVYLKFNLKKAIVFFKGENLTQYIMPNSYFWATNYPSTSAAFKFGVVWRFFD